MSDESEMRQDPGGAAPIRAAELRRLRRHHAEILLGAIAIVTMSLLLAVTSSGTVTFSACPQYSLPQACGSRYWLGIDCPGCGLSRSFILLFHGQWQASVEMHRLGWLVAIVVLAQFPYRVYCLAIKPDDRGWERVRRFAFYSLMALLVANWLYNRFA